MIQNIKVDLVYYKTNTDFEMEFNLCGCCRMRLLNDKVSDRKTLIHSLARAVSRSKIIIIVGPLFGEDGITELASGALSSETAIADNKTYGISGDEKIRILKGSTPLVTPEGYFGGCIIESGPQTMILISDNKNVRKSIMQSLIHPYIEEVAMGGNAEPTPTPATDETQEENTVEESLEEPNGETAEEISTEEILEETADETENNEESETEAAEEENEIEEIPMENSYKAEENKNSLISHNTDYEEDEDDSEFITEITPPPVFDFNSFASQDDENDEFFADDDYSDYRLPTYGKGLNISMLIIAALLLVVLAILCYCIFYVPSKDGIDAATYIREIFDTLFG